ncbi:MAG: DUF58 domain-containing protein [Anaerolineae bacterium]|nr:DUF58 domain-containing protein [Anaerolineae bacterium]MDK1081037.1 DUF58 domain-containing protein [Anaerolineae bacterium]MDK1118698.1 DUF58 domain-containing protein [Anaerolineae bacterium]
MKTTIKLKRPLLPLLAVIAFILYLFQVYRGWYILFLGLGATWLSAYLWAYSLSKNLRLSREQRFGWARVGDKIEERITLSNKYWIPALWVEMIYHSTLPGYHPMTVTGVPGGATNRWREKGVCLRRGIFELGPIDMISGDPLGIYTVTQHYPEQTSMMVTPPIINLPGIEVAPGGRSGDGRQKRKSLEVTVNVSNVREFAAGDSMRLIHWPTTARRDNIFVKVMDSTPSSDWWILLDLDESTQYGKGNFSTEEHAIILAASITEQGLRTGFAVGLATHGAELVWRPPRFGEEQRQEIMQELARATHGNLSLAQLLLYARPIFRQNPSLIIITSNLNPLWTNELSTFLGSGIVPTVLLLDPNGYTPKGAPQIDPSKLLNKLSEQGITHYMFEADAFDHLEDITNKHSSSQKWGETTPVNNEWRLI